jgi:hypothetical protein
MPKGFVKVRHYGLLANGHRVATLALCRWLLALVAAALTAATAVRVKPARPACCPVCGVGVLVWVEVLPGAAGSAPRRRPVAVREDTS